MNVLKNKIMDKETFVQMEISYKAALHNYKYFRSKLKPSTKLLILIKANSYGHGAVDFAKLMTKAGADYFAVAHPVEGVELRKGGIKKPILVLTAGTDYYKEIIQNNLEPGIPNIESLKKFDSVVKAMKVKSYPVHIKLDTGMHRLGFMESELPELLKYLKAHKEIKVKSIYSHLAASDEPKWDKFTLGQIALYDKMAPQIDKAIGYKPIHHILNSAGIERFSKYQKDMVRLGIGIYGISAVNQKYVKPVASLKCKILQIKHLVPADGTVGYGRHGKIDKPTVTATLPVGYADGINRHFGRGNAKFMLKGKMVPTIGNICMDMCMIDITGVKNAKVGDVVTIFGEKPTAQDLAKILDTIPYEIFTSIAKRIKRVVVK